MINLFVTCQGNWCGSKLKLYDTQRGAATEDMLVTAETIADALTRWSSASSAPWKDNCD